MDRFEFTGSRDFVHASESLKSARDAISRLNVEERSLLLQEMLGGQDHQLILGGGNVITTNVVVQIQSGDVNLSEVFRAAAYRVSKEI